MNFTVKSFNVEKDMQAVNKLVTSCMKYFIKDQSRITISYSKKYKGWYALDERAGDMGLRVGVLDDSQELVFRFSKDGSVVKFDESKFSEILSKVQVQDIAFLNSITKDGSKIADQIMGKTD